MEIQGRIPPTLGEEGDTAFERSRERAQVAFEKLQSDLKKRHRSEELVQLLHEIRTGTGHRTSSIVTKHYFQPGREEFRRILANKMPTLLAG